MIWKLFITFLQIGAFSFGGGYGMLPMIEKYVITENAWIEPNVFVDIIATSQITPGPIAINSATFIGYKMAGFWGAFWSTLGVITVPVMLILVLSHFLIAFKESVMVKAIFDGLRPALVGLILASAFSVSKTAIQDIYGGLIALGIFILINKTKIHPILLILLAAVTGVFLYH